MRSRSLCCWVFLTISARVGASVPRPHTASAEPAALAHAARARCRAAAQCPAPTAAWVTTGAAADTHARVPAGLIPSMARRNSSSCTRALLLSRAIPALSPRRRECAKLPGCRYPDAAARRGQGASTQVRRWRRAGGTGFQGAGGAKGKLTEAQAAELEEVLARKGFLAKPHRVRELDALQGDPDEVRARLSEHIPLRRYGEPEEFGRAAAFVLSPAASYITGAMIPVDGGAISSI